jgi:hypothetical protein
MQNDPVGELFPDLSANEITIACENLDRYLEIVWEIWEELRAQEAAALTNGGTIPTIKERSNKQNNETKL